MPSSPAEVAWNKILANDGPKEILSIYEDLFSNKSNLDDRNFTLLHKIVLRLDSKDLGTHLHLCSQTEIARRDHQGQTALHWAARRGDAEMVKLLLNKGSDPNIQSKAGFSALHYASKCGSIGSIEELIEHGAMHSVRNSMGYTPLTSLQNSLIPEEAYLACARCLLDAGADINAQDLAGATSLIHASQLGFPVAIDFLLNRGADVNKPGFDGETALAVAIQGNKHEVPPILFAHGASLAQHTLSGRSILHEAAQFGDERSLQILTSARIRGVKIDRKSLDGNTARDLAQKRTNVTPEWRAAFADLLASVDETLPALPQSTVEMSTRSSKIPRMRASDLMRIVEDGLYESMIKVQDCVNQLPQLRTAKSSALLVFLAIAWYVLARS